MSTDDTHIFTPLLQSPFASLLLAMSSGPSSPQPVRSWKGGHILPQILTIMESMHHQPNMPPCLFQWLPARHLRSRRIAEMRHILTQILTNMESTHNQSYMPHRNG